MKLQATVIFYNVSMTTKEMLRLMELDFINDVQKKMDRLGVYNVEYDGHFGPNFMFALAYAKRNNADKVVACLKKLVQLS